MCVRRVAPSLLSISAAISSCEDASEWEVALSLFEELCSMNSTPDVVSFNATMSACGKGSQGRIALRLFSSMRALQVFPDSISFNTAIGALEEQWQGTLGLLLDMAASRVDATATALSAAFALCERAGQRLIALKLLDELQSSLF
ncbi:unnamed protein product [Symbiodinium microadriaticum]|nr:unnamed protein product [Symbiodinium microadriaticum]